MKSFKQLISEVAQPKSQDEINFKDKHLYDKIDYPVDGTEGQFTSDKKKATRNADYEDDEDQEVYESTQLDENNYSVFKSMPAAPGKSVSNKVQIKAFKTSDQMNKFLSTGDNALQWKDTGKQGLKSGAYKMDMRRGPDGKPARDFIREVSDTKESAFVAKAAAAKKAGKDEFELGDKKFPVTIKKATADKIMEKKTYGPGHIGAIQKMIDKEREAKKAKDAMKKESFDLDDLTLDELEDFMMSEEFEQLDEISKKTLGSYIKKATTDAMGKAYRAGDVRDKDSSLNYMKALGRQIGISKATNKLTKESFEELDEEKKLKFAISKNAKTNGYGIAQWTNYTWWYHSDNTKKYFKTAADAKKYIENVWGKGHTIEINESADLDEAAPKMKPDFLKTQREKDRAHDAAMGRTPTGRKKPMTSTQRSMASMREAKAAMKKEHFDINEEREPAGRFGKNVNDYEIKMNGRVDKIIKKGGPVYDSRNNTAYKTANSHLQTIGKKHGVDFDKLHRDITGYYAFAKPGQDTGKIHTALIDYEKTVGKYVNEEYTVETVDDLTESTADIAISSLISAINKNRNKPEFQKAADQFEKWGQRYRGSYRNLLNVPGMAGSFFSDLVEILDIRVDLDEEPQPKWKVQIGNRHYTVTGRSTMEADRKAKILAKKDGNVGVGGKIERLKEEVELDEVSKKTLGNYVRKAADDMAYYSSRKSSDYSNTADGHKAYVRDNKKRVKRGKGIDLAVYKLTGEEVELDEAVAKIACLNCDEVSTAAAWKKNRGFCPKCKVSNQGVAEEVELDEVKRAPKMKPDFFKQQRDSDIARNLAQGKTPTGREKRTRTQSSTQKSLASIRKESIDLTENFKAGSVKLNDGSTVIVKKQDADLLNQMFKDLNAQNKKQMMKVAMTDKSGFEEILGFAREAL